jgi:hypothetical protein
MSAQAYFLIATVHPPVREDENYHGFDLRTWEVEDAIKAWKDKPVYYEHDYSLPPIGYVVELFQREDRSIAAKMVISDKHPHAQEVIRMIAAGELGSTSLGSVVNEGTFVDGKCRRMIATEITLCEVPARDNTNISKMATVYDGNVLSWSIKAKPNKENESQTLTSNQQVNVFSSDVNGNSAQYFQQQQGDENEMQNSRIDTTTSFSPADLATMANNGMTIAAPPAVAAAPPPPQQQYAPPPQQQQYVAPPQQQQQVAPPQQQQVAPPQQQQQQQPQVPNGMYNGFSSKEEMRNFYRAQNGVLNEDEEIAFWQGLAEASHKQKNEMVEGVFTEEEDEWGLKKSTVVAMDDKLVGVLCSLKGGLRQMEAQRKAAEDRYQDAVAQLQRKDTELIQEKTARAVLEKDRSMYMKNLPVRSVDERFAAPKPVATPYAGTPAYHPPAAMAPPPGYQQHYAPPPQQMVPVNASGGNYAGLQYRQAAPSIFNRDGTPKDLSGTIPSERMTALSNLAQSVRFKKPTVEDMFKKARVDQTQ